MLPFTLGPTLAAAFDERSEPVQVVASIGVWGSWSVVLVATLVPHPLGLTALRVAAPAALAAALAAAAIDGHGSALAVPTSCISLALAWSHETSMVFVNGPAYPNERRYPLRVPAPLLLGILPAAWLLAVGPVVVGVLLLAAKQWLAGGVVLVAGLPLAAVLMRALHGLSRRWLVFVPAGLVLHDPMTLADPVLFPRQTIDALRPAPAGSGALDLTQRAPGLALQLVLKEKAAMVLTKPGRRLGQAGAWDQLLITPTRPGAVLAEAAARRIATRPNASV